jgi:hypothetical protein
LIGTVLLEPLLLIRFAEPNSLGNTGFFYIIPTSIA